ncbi:hypothetical protein LINGRAHAP2_LOCUS23634 [Linum grandiflorum]
MPRLEYPGVALELSYLKESGRMEFTTQQPTRKQSMLTKG